MRPFPASLCTGEVFHRRVEPVEHEFRYDISFVWFDPDAPDEVADLHPLWSCTRPAPARFRGRDYGYEGAERAARSLGTQARDDVAFVLGHRPGGSVRMLTQWRRWGWLFNPITVVFVWDDDAAPPVGAVLEVTNTPWKERHRYPVALDRSDDEALTAEFDKALHVSPFLDEDYRYRLRVEYSGHDTADDANVAEMRVGLDVVDANDALVLATGMRLDLVPATRRSLAAALRHDGLPTHRVSAGIHAQAARLWRRVPFVPHPSKRDRTPASQRDGLATTSRR
jgi:uncharacterized protein